MAAQDIFRRAFDKGLAILGEPSLLDGVPCGHAEVRRDVQMFAGLFDQANDNHVVRADTASIKAVHNPRVDQVLTHPSQGRYRLTRLLVDDGVERRFIAVKVP